MQLVGRLQPIQIDRAVEVVVPALIALRARVSVVDAALGAGAEISEDAVGVGGMRV